jgi:hypothetical protein
MSWRRLDGVGRVSNLSAMARHGRLFGNSSRALQAMCQKKAGDFRS